MKTTWVQREIDTNSYSRFACDGYLIEVIPDVSGHEYSKILVHIKSISQVQSQKHPDFIGHIESAYIELNIENISPNDWEVPVTAKSENVIYGYVFEVELSGKYWELGKLMTGILRISLHSK